MIDYKVKNRVNAPSLADIRFGGKIGEQVSRFFEERVKSDFAKNVVYKETYEQFLLRNDDDLAIGYWRGEFWGKWIISACRVARYESNGELTEFIKNAALELIATADEDGYIGTYKNPENVLPADPEKGREVVGVLCDFNWNVWCRKYTLWGLLEAYMLTEDERILAAADKFANQLFDMLARLGIKITECGTFNGLPAGSTMKPLLILYRLTGKKKYLKYAFDIANDWERPDGKVPNIISNALAMKPVHEWYPLPEKWAKAYEMMSCIDGLIELYRVSSDAKYLKTAENMYELLKEHEGNLLFSVGFNDQFAHGAAWPNSISEPCDVIHWIRMCYELYTLTADVKYMNTIELAFYNPLRAGFFKDGKWGARGVRSVGRHMVASGQASMKHSHCCVNNIPRGVLNVGQCFVMESEGELIINLYTDFCAKIGGATVKIGGSYLADGKVTVTVDAERDMTLKLRVPAFSRKTLLGGKEISAENGYASVKVGAGKTELLLEFDMQITLRELDEAPEHFPSQDFRVRRFVYDNIVTEDMMTWDARATLVYGPLLLTRSKLVGSTEEEMFDSASVAHRGFKCSVAPTECEGVNYAFRVSFENEKESIAFDMCDYASGTNVWSEDDMKLFNVFI